MPGLSVWGASGSSSSYSGIQGFFFFFPSASSVFFLDMVLVFFLSSFLGIEWTTGARSQLVFLYSEFYSIIRVIGGPCYFLGAQEF